MDIGIDLGDTNFRISYLENGIPRLLEDDTGRTFFPSQVSFLQGGGTLVAYDSQSFGIPENTVIHPITLAMSKKSDLNKLNRIYNNRFFLQNDHIHIDAHRIYPKIEDVLQSIFAHAKKLTEKHLQQKADNVIIAIPDGLDAPSRNLIKNASEKAGLRVRQLLNQTVSACLGYRLDRGKNKNDIIVIDIGASHTSASVLEGGRDRLVVKKTENCPIGVNDLQRKFITLINEKYFRKTDINLLQSNGDFIREELSYIAPFFFEELSRKEKVTASIGSANPDGSRAIVDIYQYELEHYLSTELIRIREMIIRLHNKKPSSLLLIGGGANIPIIQAIIMNIYRQRPQNLTNVKVEEAVALGASVKNGILNGEIISDITEITVHDLGTFVRGNEMDVLIPKGTKLPVNVYKKYGLNTRSYTEKVYQWTGPGSGQFKREYDPDLVVLAEKTINTMTGRGVGNRFIIDESGIPKFIAVDLGNGREYELTDFEVTLS